MYNLVYVPTKHVRNIVDATFPDYKRHKVAIIATNSVSIYGLNWDGGSRYQYRAATLDGRKAGNLDRYNNFAPWDNPANGSTVDVVPGACIVKGGTFCGKPAMLYIYVRPEDLTPMLPIN
jgi:hypothetical protein